MILSKLRLLKTYSEVDEVALMKVTDSLIGPACCVPAFRRARRGKGIPCQRRGDLGRRTKLCSWQIRTIDPFRYPARNMLYPHFRFLLSFNCASDASSLLLLRQIRCLESERVAAGGHRT